MPELWSSQIKTSFWLCENVLAGLRGGRAAVFVKCKQNHFTDGAEFTPGSWKSCLYLHYLASMCWLFQIAPRLFALPELFLHFFFPQRWRVNKLSRVFGQQRNAMVRVAVIADFILQTSSSCQNTSEMMYKRYKDIRESLSFKRPLEEFKYNKEPASLILRFQDK